MIVHGSPLSPFVRKVMVYCGERGIAIDNKPGQPGPKTPEFLEMSPFGKIPAFEDGDYKLCDSSAIVHYLEAKHAGDGLIPSEAKARGRAIWFEEFADTIMFPAMAAVFFNRIVARLLGLPQDLAAADKAVAEAVPPLYAYLETQIPASGFLVEDRFTIADLAVVAPIANMKQAGEPVDAGKFPKLAAYSSAIMARPAFAAQVALCDPILVNLTK
jgi:glutathione S-transferase